MVERTEAEGAWVRVRKSQLCLKRTISFVKVGEGVRGSSYRWPCGEA